MEYINLYGLVIMIAIMLPNIVFAYKEKNENLYHNKAVEICEQIGRFWVNVPYGF